MLNLLSNSLKFTEKGFVEIKAEAELLPLQVDNKY